MDNNLLDSDDSEIETETKTYTPEEMNHILLSKTTTIANNFEDINMIGDIVLCKLWKGSGMDFKLMNNKESFECNVWIRDGCDLNKVQQHENMNCRIT